MSTIKGDKYVRDNGDRLYERMCNVYSKSAVDVSCGRTAKLFIDTMRGYARHNDTTILNAIKFYGSNNGCYACVICKELLRYAEE